MTEKQECSLAQSSDAVTEENPYVKVVTKKLRNLKKKLEKAVQVEQLSTAGKALNEEQLILLQSRPGLERAIADIDTIKTQLDGLCKEFPVEDRNDRSNSMSSSSAPAHHDSTPPPTRAMEDIIIATEMVSAGTQYEKIESQDLVSSSSSEHCKLVTSVSVEVMVGIPLAEADIQKKKEEDALKKSLVSQHSANMKFLMRALHVYTGYTLLMSKPLPTEVDYFGKSALGLTSIVGFEDTLQSSLRFIEKLSVTDKASETLLAPGVTLADFEKTINRLSAEMNKLGKRQMPTSVAAALEVTTAPIAATASTSAAIAADREPVQPKQTAPANASVGDAGGSRDRDGSAAMAVAPTSTSTEAAAVKVPPKTILFGQYFSPLPVRDGSVISAMGNMGPPELAMINPHAQMMMYQNGQYMGGQYMGHHSMPHHPQGGLSMVPLDIDGSSVAGNMNMGMHVGASIPGGMLHYPGMQLDRYDVDPSMYHPSMHIPADYQQQQHQQQQGYNLTFPSAAIMASSKQGQLHEPAEPNNISSNTGAANDVASGAFASKQANSKPSKSAKHEKQKASVKDEKDVNIGLLIKTINVLRQDEQGGDSGNAQHESMAPSGTEVDVALSVVETVEQLNSSLVSDDLSLAGLAMPLTTTEMVGDVIPGTATSTAAASTTISSGKKKKNKKSERLHETMKAPPSPDDVKLLSQPPSKEQNTTTVQPPSPPQQQTKKVEQDPEGPADSKPVNASSKRDEEALARFLAEKSRLEQEKKLQQQGNVDEEEGEGMEESQTRGADKNSQHKHEKDENQLRNSAGHSYGERADDAGSTRVVSMIQPDYRHTATALFDSANRERETLRELEAENLRLQLECVRLQDAERLRQEEQARLQLEADNLRLQEECKRLQEAAAVAERRLQLEDQKRAIELEMKSQLEKEEKAAKQEEDKLRMAEETQRKKNEELQRSILQEEMARLEKEARLLREREKAMALEEEQKRQAQEQAQDRLRALEAERVRLENEAKLRKEEEIRQRVAAEQARIEEQRRHERELAAVEERRRAIDRQRKELEAEAKTLLEKRKDMSNSRTPKTADSSLRSLDFHDEASSAPHLPRSHIAPNYQLGKPPVAGSGGASKMSPVSSLSLPNPHPNPPHDHRDFSSLPPPLPPKFNQQSSVLGAYSISPSQQPVYAVPGILAPQPGSLPLPVFDEDGTMPSSNLATSGVAENKKALRKRLWLENAFKRKEEKKNRNRIGDGQSDNRIEDGQSADDSQDVNAPIISDNSHMEKADRRSGGDKYMHNAGDLAAQLRAIELEIHQLSAPVPSSPAPTVSSVTPQQQRQQMQVSNQQGKYISSTGKHHMPSTLTSLDSPFVAAQAAHSTVPPTSSPPPSSVSSPADVTVPTNRARSPSKRSVSRSAGATTTPASASCHPPALAQISTPAQASGGPLTQTPALASTQTSGSLGTFKNQQIAHVPAAASTESLTKREESTEQQHTPAKSTQQPTVNMNTSIVAPAVNINTGQPTKTGKWKPKRHQG